MNEEVESQEEGALLAKCPKCHPNAGRVRYAAPGADRRMPKDHFVWSLLSLICFSPQVGLAALIYSIKARHRKEVGDLESARRFASTARTLNIIAAVLCCVVVVIVVLVTIVYVQSFKYNDVNNYGG